MSGSPPPCRAAMMMARLSLLHNLPRLASIAPFLCLMVAQWEWPDMASPSRLQLRDQKFELLLQVVVSGFHFSTVIAFVVVQGALPGGAGAGRQVQAKVHI